MAASNAYSMTSDHFKMPSEPCPLPSLGSDEESFVVLWKDMDSKSLSGDSNEPVGASVVEEAKELIKKELLQLERSEAPLTNAVDGQNHFKNDKAENDTQSLAKMEQSTALPKMPQVEKGFDTPDVISITTFSTDLTSEEVQRKIAQIIEENIRLKDTILQNNMSMKSQYERIVAWQEDVQKVHQAHKEKIIEAKEFIEKLKKENHSLVQDLEKLRELKNSQETELSLLKNTLQQKEQCANEKLVESAETNIKEFELDVANKKVRELEVAIENMTLENDNLKDHKTKLMEDVKKIEDYEKEIECLRDLLHASKMQVEETKMELLKVKSVEQEKQKGLSIIIENLRSQLSLAQQHAAPLEELANTRQQLVSIQIVLTQVEQSRAAAYAQIQAQNSEISQLKAKLQDAEAQQDEIYALKTQLDVYKADFEAERNAKDTIKMENNKYSEDMQNLQRRNQQLQDEIEMIRENRDYVVYPTRRREGASSSSSPSSNHSFKCPKCNFGFYNMQALENHVYRCIELDDHLP